MEEGVRGEGRGEGGEGSGGFFVRIKRLPVRIAVIRARLAS